MSSDRTNKRIASGKLTDAQIRAKAWLPSDGSWRINPGRLAIALNSLSMAWPMCVECEWGDFGPRGGLVQRWRLTEHGVRVKEIVDNVR